MKEKFFWGDNLAEKIIKQKPSKKEYVCASGITPSGTVHIGNFREVITTELVVRALKNKGKKVSFIYSWDDYDRFRKVPANVPKEWEKYIGMPLSEVPSPFGKGSYAEYFERGFEKSLKKVSVNPKFTRQSIMNKKCKYADLIKKAIEKKEIIIKILNKYRKEPLNKDWFPVVVYCEKCMKDYTKVLSFENYDLKYKCRCGFENKIDIRKKGNLKLKWRIDWPARWKYEGVDFEPGGKDHSAYGGSFMTGKEIVEKVFNYKPPLYQIYEWIKIKGGGQFSSSLGDALTLNDVSEIYEPEVLRYLFVGTRPNRAFQISFDNDVIKIYDEFDRLEEKYYNKKAGKQEKRIYELSKINIDKKMPKRESFRHLITLIQVGETNNLTSYGKKRGEKVKNWLKKYAKQDMKFKIQKEIKIKLNEKQKKALKELKEFLQKKDYNQKKLSVELYEIPKRNNMDLKEFFKTNYEVLIGKSKGPKLFSLIIAIGEKKVMRLLNKIR
jgi:lysyl-tRNA synthetase class 1